VRTHDEWESWVEFFLSGVEETSNQAVRAAREIMQLLEQDRSRLEKIGRPASSALRLHHLLERNPMISISVAAAKLRLSVPTVATAWNIFVSYRSSKRPPVASAIGFSVMSGILQFWRKEPSRSTRALRTSELDCEIPAMKLGIAPNFMLAANQPV